MQDNFEEKFNQIYEREYKRIFLIACSYMKNVADSEDVCQITFEKYIKHKPDFDCIEQEQAWFVKTASNTCKNLLELSWKKKTTLIYEDEILENLANNLERNEVVDGEYNLLVEVQELPIKYREVIHLFYYEEYSVKEIAELLGLKVSAVTTRLERARKKLGDKLERRGNIW